MVEDGFIGGSSGAGIQWLARGGDDRIDLGGAHASPRAFAWGYGGIAEEVVGEGIEG